MYDLSVSRYQVIPEPIRIVLQKYYDERDMLQNYIHGKALLDWKVEHAIDFYIKQGLNPKIELYEELVQGYVSTAEKEED